MENRDFETLIKKYIREETKYLRMYDGQVVELLEEARVKCTIEALGWDDEDKAANCILIDKNSLTTLKEDDYVKIGFINGNPAKAFVLGLANNFEDMLASSYEDENNIDVIYEDRDGKVKFTYDKDNDELKLYADSGIKIIIENGDGAIIDMNDNTVDINDGNHEVDI